MKSIMHDKKEGTCYLCKILHGDDSRKQNLEEHHVMYGAGNRKMSEKYGLKVYLCFYHHTYVGGPEAVHRNDAVRRLLEAEAQKAFEKVYPNLVFRDIFGKNVTESTSWQQEYNSRQQGAGQGDGFMFID